MTTAFPTDYRREIRVPAGTSSYQLQAIVDQARAPCVIRLDAGFYRFDSSIRIRCSGICLLGAGVDRTVIVPNLGNPEDPVVEVQGPTFGRSWRPTRSMEEGCRSLHLPTGHDLRPGDVVWLERANTHEDMASLPTVDWPEDRPVHTSMARLESVHGDVAVLECGVHEDFPMIDTVVREVRLIRNAEIGRFTILHPFDDTPSTCLVEDTPRSRVAATISISGCFNSSIHNILIRGAPATGVVVRRCLKLSGDGLAVIGQANLVNVNDCAFHMEDTYESKLINLEDQNFRRTLSFATFPTEINNYVHVRGAESPVELPGDRIPMFGGEDPLRGVEWLFVEGGEVFAVPDLLGIGQELPPPSNENDEVLIQ